jgi:hypothetical protein
MHRSLLVAFLFGASTVAGAQGLTFAEVKAKNATQLTADALRELMPGAKVVSRTPQGSTRYWQNKLTELSFRRRMAAEAAEDETVLPPAPVLGGFKTTERYA